MKAKHLAITTISLLLLGSTALADRQLEKAEILAIFEELTSRPTNAWISEGTIRATHEEYRAPETTSSSEINSQIQKAIQEHQNNPNERVLTEELQKMLLDAIPFNVRYELSNEYTMNSTVLVEYDGSRFNWEIDVKSRTDSVRPDASLANNYMTKEFNMDWNRSRAFTWDGSKYTLYSRSANYALVDTKGRLPHVVSGPLTAGVIPWGYNDFTYSRLSSISSSGEEKDVVGGTQIHLTLKMSDSTVLLVMNPKMDYALISTLEERSETTTSTEYANHRLISGRWVPMAISIEEYDRWTNKLLGYDVWSFSSVSTSTPVLSAFSVAFEPDALIEYHSPLSNRALTYRYTPMLDMDALLSERLNVIASRGTRTQNCATVALRYAALQLGRDMTDQQLARLVDNTGGTSLKAMKDMAINMGLHARAVRTDVEGLKNLNGCQAILHFPGKNHFVVLGDIDNSHVWCVDLASDRFCYQANIHFLGMDWTEGTVLLVSDGAIPDGFSEIADTELRVISGGDGYTCSELLQEEDVYFCSYFCDGSYEYYPERWGCEEAESGMCLMSKMLSCAEAPCLSSWRNDCYTGEWHFSYMYACE
ncbi:MAG: hypothetical protein JXM79_14215 [Sedimentisphaerales bacterium]|nr:hypothetical protein [Sedimentisphaerales bacterium]